MKIIHLLRLRHRLSVLDGIPARSSDQPKICRPARGRRTYLVATQRPFREETLGQRSYARLPGVDGYTVELSDDEAQVLAETSGVWSVEPDVQRFVSALPLPRLDGAEMTPWRLIEPRRPANLKLSCAATSRRFVFLVGRLENWRVAKSLATLRAEICADRRPKPRNVSGFGANVPR
jgi:hypothetical protein